jgi:hypothetical protein
MMVSPVIHYEASDASKMHGEAIPSTLRQRPIPTREAIPS